MAPAATRTAARAASKAAPDHVVADLSLADWGRKEIAIAEHEMPGLMAIRKKYAPGQGQVGHHIVGAGGGGLPFAPGRLGRGGCHAFSSP